MTLLDVEEDRESVTLTIRCYALTVGDEDADEILLRKFWLPSIDNPAPREFRDFEITVREVTQR